jgi:hypothetical protein
MYWFLVAARFFPVFGFKQLRSAEMGGRGGGRGKWSCEGEGGGEEIQSDLRYSSLPSGGYSKLFRLLKRHLP